MPEKLIFEISKKGKKGYSLPPLDIPERDGLIPAHFLRNKDLGLLEVSEPEVIRHFINLSSMNHHVDKGFYPLGSCTMKYNPKVNEEIASWFCFTHIHPFQDEETVQGALRLMDELGRDLCEIGGMDRVTLQPAAGAHGELTGLLVMRAYHKLRGNPRRKVIITDSAHGTNPASIHLAGYEGVEIKSNPQGLVDLDALRGVMDEDVAAFMITNPNTLGLFETQILEVARVVHDAGALLYMDGANLNALMGIVRPGDMGFDVVHFNLHKTFSTPHGGGGPGSGPVGVKEHLAEFLPVPLIKQRTLEPRSKPARPGISEEMNRSPASRYYLDYELPNSIGRMHSFFGNFGVLVKAYVYIKMLGGKGLKRVAENALINANYVMEKLKSCYHLPYPGPCMHEFVLSAVKQKEMGVKALDVAKRLLDFDVHAPTVYFPLIVPEALMIEPTETEGKESLDHFIQAMEQIAGEAERRPEVVHNAPHTTPMKRLDEVRAARWLNVSYLE
ncbi:aminomethyl-transferring glycine dehydrogenase subunit GcvPB [candidate division KSB1 bacterium]|nr:aminomethyl-transferring glycine dehydrogenase subunit GcvPB [candidate division KSB1 bacterium]